MSEFKSPSPLSQKEAAVYLGISVSTLRRWHKVHQGPRFFRLGGVLRYRVEDLDAFLVDHLSAEN